LIKAAMLEKSITREKAEYSSMHWREIIPTSLSILKGDNRRLID